MRARDIAKGAGAPPKGGKRDVADSDPQTSPELARLWKGLSALPPAERLGALDRFAEELGSAFFANEVGELQFTAVRDLFKFRRALARDQQKTPMPSDDGGMEPLTLGEWSGEPHAELVARAAAAAGVGVAQLLRARREIDATKTTSAPPADLEALAAAGADR